ncbi:ATP-binding response regulator [Desulfonatronum lacustre]|uniref:ATP-binding response regulator n=1 Tax=Desulfonatronum lacustre TaxID=66849 RepID=UPI000490793F|nr:response regulator [Desulfonatronum lacustre]
MDKIEALLRQMRRAFLNEMGERCDRLEQKIIQLERTPADRDVFEELYRGVHSLKGSGGTHGLHIITAICHQFENLLTEASGACDFSDNCISKSLAYIDLLRKVQQVAGADDPDYASLEAELERLREPEKQRRIEVLMAEPSNIMQQVLRKALADQPVQITMVDDGIAAIELLMRHKFQVAVLARELVRLNGVAVVAAIRASQGRNAKIPFILLTSNPETVPRNVAIDKVLPRDKHLMVEVLQTLTGLTGSRTDI